MLPTFLHGNSHAHKHGAHIPSETAVTTMQHSFMMRVQTMLDSSSGTSASFLVHHFGFTMTLWCAMPTLLMC